MKKCFYCAEDIQDEAIKCKHCGEFLEDTNKESTSKNTENKGNISHEYKTIKVYAGLNDYLYYLPFFGWEIIGNQKVNYSSNSSSNNSGRVGSFDKKSYSGKENTNTTYHYYNELSLKRIKGKIEKELFNIEGEFFDHIYKIHNYFPSSEYYTFSTFLFFCILICLPIFLISIGKVYGGDFGEMIFTVFILDLIIIIPFTYFYGKKYNKEVNKRRKEIKPELNKKYKDFFIKYKLI